MKLRIFLCAVFVSVLSVIESQAQSTVSVTAAVSLSSDWQTGYNVSVNVTPNVNITTWSIVINVPVGSHLATTSDYLWNAIYSVSGTQYTFTPTSGNAIIAANQTTNFGFKVDGITSSTPRIGASSIINATGITASNPNSQVVLSAYWSNTGQDIFMNPAYTGNVGVGTITPTAKFSIVNSSGPSTMNLQQGTNTPFWITSQNNGLQIGGTGATYPANGAINIQSNGIVGMNNVDISGTLYTRQNLYSLNKAGNSWLPWSSRNTTTPEVTIDLSNINNISAQGKVGIGTASPTANLSLLNAAAATLNLQQGTNNPFWITSQNNGLQIGGTGTTTPTTGAINVDNNGNVTFAKPVNFATGNLTVNSLPILSSQWSTNGTNINYNTGNIGVGTANPTANLSVSNASINLQQGTSNPFWITSQGTNLQIGGYGTTTPTTGAINIDNTGNVNFAKNINLNGTFSINNQVIDLTKQYEKNANVSLGLNAGSLDNSTNNTFIGAYAGQRSNSHSNTFIGTGSGMSNVDGAQNVCIGNIAGANSITTYDNVFLGNGAGIDNISGSYNVFVGAGAGTFNNNGNENVYVGIDAGAFNTGSGNIFLGSNSGYNGQQNLSLSDKLIIGNQNKNLIVGDIKTGNIGIGAVSNSYYDIFSNPTLGRLQITGNGVNQGIALNYDAANIREYRMYIDGPKTYFIRGTDNSLGFNMDENGNVSFMKNVSALGGQFTIAKDNNATTVPTFYTNPQGQVGINTTTIPTDFKLAVNGKVIATAIRIKEYGQWWPDFVFEKGYGLLNLKDVKTYVEKNKHLPGIPSAEEVKKNGTDVGEVQAKLLQKVEELTLYMIQQQEKIEQMEKELSFLKASK
jgi:trimeric autotransporter adhesin